MPMQRVTFILIIKLGDDDLVKAKNLKKVSEPPAEVCPIYSATRVA
jgi:hypothetical protein